MNKYKAMYNLDMLLIQPIVFFFFKFQLVSDNLVGIGNIKMVQTQEVVTAELRYVPSDCFTFRPVSSKVTSA